MARSTLLLSPRRCVPSHTQLVAPQLCRTLYNWVCASSQVVGVEVTAGGIVPGDRVISIDGIAVDDVTTLQARLDDKNVGDVVVLLVERAGKTREMLVELQPGV